VGKHSDFAYDGKLGGLIRIVGGLCLCIFGTWLIQEAHYEDKLEQRKLANRKNDGAPEDEDLEPMTFIAPVLVPGMKQARGAADFRFSSAGDDSIEVDSEGENEQADEEVCPDCGAKMVVRRVSKGPHAGRAFWVCVKYPQCKSIVPIRSEVAAQMEF
jgi:ribosomal protein L37AE/L43A